MVVRRRDRQVRERPRRRRARRAGRARATQLRPVLAPRHPCHRSGSLSGGRGRRAGARAPCRRAAAPRDRRDRRSRTGSTIGPSVGTSSVSWRPLWRSRTTSRDAADRAERPPRAGQQPVRLEQLLDVPLEPDAAAGQQHDVVADALDVGDRRARRSRRSRRVSATPSISSCRNSRPASGSRLGERLVEQDEPRPLAERQREREPGALAGGERADLRCASRCASSSSTASSSVPARVRPARELDRVGDA